MSDPLGLLRQATINNQLASVQLVGDDLSIGSQSFPRNTKTILINSKSHIPYELVEVWFFLSNPEFSKPSTYYRASRVAKIGDIHIGDQKRILAYMKGDDSSSIAMGPSSLPLLRKPKALDGPLSTIPEAQIASDSLAKPPQQWTIHDIFAQEKWLTTTATLLQNPKDVDLSVAIKIFDDAVKKRLRPPPPKVEVKSANPRATIVSPVPMKRPRTEESVIPIIVVPQAPTAVLSMYNAFDFLNLGVYKSAEEAKATNGDRKPELAVCERKSYLNPQKNCKYHVLDNVTKIPPDQWYRVVAVFATGADWQFRDWPWKQPAEIFDNVKGFHLFYDDEALNAKIAKWNVHKLAISKIKRYRDRSVVTDFWETLHNFIQTRNGQRQLVF